MKSKLLIISPVYNEERLLPFHFHYYNHLIDLQKKKKSNLIYIDFGSDDSSVELIQSFSAQNPNVSLIHCDTKEHREDVLTLFRNHYYKQFSNPAGESNYDWVFTVDIDEFLFNNRLIEILDLKKGSDTTIFKTKGYDVVMDNVPEIKFTCKDILNNYTLEGMRDTSLDKNLIFNPSKVDIRHTFGCHGAHPTGDVFWDDTVIYNLSFRYLGVDYFRHINTEKNKRAKEYAKKENYGNHYEKNLAGMDSNTKWYNDYTRKKELLNLGDFDERVNTLLIRHKELEEALKGARWLRRGGKLKSTLERRVKHHIRFSPHGLTDEQKNKFAYNSARLAAFENDVERAQFRPIRRRPCAGQKSQNKA